MTTSPFNCRCCGMSLGTEAHQESTCSTCRREERATAGSGCEHPQQETE